MDFALANLPWHHATIADLNMHHFPPLGRPGCGGEACRVPPGGQTRGFHSGCKNTFEDKRTELPGRVHLPLIRLQRIVRPVDKRRASHPLPQADFKLLHSSCSPALRRPSVRTPGTALFLRDVEARPESADAGVAHRAAGVTHWFSGEYREAREHLERALALFQPGRDEDLAFRFGGGPVRAANGPTIPAWT